MTASRDELIHLIEGLPDDQVEAVLADVRQLTTQPSPGEWPPRFFGVGESNDGRTTTHGESTRSSLTVSVPNARDPV